MQFSIGKVFQFSYQSFKKTLTFVNINLKESEIRSWAKRNELAHQMGGRECIDDIRWAQALKLSKGIIKKLELNLLKYFNDEIS